MLIAVVNPNTTSSMTEKIGDAARAAASPVTEINATNPAMGPASIEGFYDEAAALPGLLCELARAERDGADAAVIACFDDCGLEAARALLDIPVIGICEAAMRAASMLSTRFSVVTTLPVALPRMRELARRYGVAEQCVVRAADIPVLALEDPASDAVGAIRAEITRAIEVDQAEAIVLGCAGMTDLAARLSAEFGVPVIDGVVVAVKFAEALAALGLRTSKRGGYAAPIAKPYMGAMAFMAPDALRTKRSQGTAE